MGKQTFDKKRFQEAEVRALREQGMKVSEIAAHYGCAVSTISVVLREYGLSNERHRVHIEDRGTADVELESQNELLERYERRMQQTAEIVKRRQERIVRWQERKKKQGVKRIKHLTASEVPRGYIW